jgi:sugar O-acyltransferase (sialic acid O-acetyltransferase NeuD family)
MSDPSKTKKAVIFGVTDLAEVAHVYLTRDSAYQVVAFTAHEQYITKANLVGLPVVPFERITETHPPDSHEMFVAIGFKNLNRLRADMYSRCKALGYRLLTYVNSRAFHVDGVRAGENCFIFEANVIQPFVTIGNNVIIWCGNHVGHHVTIEDNVFIASHAVIPGHVTIGANCFIGVNATIRDGVTVGRDSIIGAGAIVLRDVAPGSVYKATPTPVARERSDQVRL